MAVLASPWRSFNGSVEPKPSWINNGQLLLRTNGISTGNDKQGSTTINNSCPHSPSKRTFSSSRCLRPPKPNRMIMDNYKYLIWNQTWIHDQLNHIDMTNWLIFITNIIDWLTTDFWCCQPSLTTIDHSQSLNHQHAKLHCWHQPSFATVPYQPPFQTLPPEATPFFSWPRESSQECPNSWCYGDLRVLFWGNSVAMSGEIRDGNEERTHLHLVFGH